MIFFDKYEMILTLEEDSYNLLNYLVFIGIGIPPSKIGELFKLFGDTDLRFSKRHATSGIGRDG